MNSPEDTITVFIAFIFHTAAQLPHGHHAALASCYTYNVDIDYVPFTFASCVLLLLWTWSTILSSIRVFTSIHPFEATVVRPLSSLIKKAIRLYHIRDFHKSPNNTIVSLRKSARSNNFRRGRPKPLEHGLLDQLQLLSRGKGVDQPEILSNTESLGNFHQLRISHSWQSLLRFPFRLPSDDDKLSILPFDAPLIWTNGQPYPKYLALCIGPIGRLSLFHIRIQDSRSLLEDDEKIFRRIRAVYNLQRGWMPQSLAFWKLQKVEPVNVFPTKCLKLMRPVYTILQKFDQSFKQLRLRTTLLVGEA